LTRHDAGMCTVESHAGPARRLPLSPPSPAADLSPTRGRAAAVSPGPVPSPPMGVTQGASRPGAPVGQVKELAC
jgi:hypothetical protein